MKVDRMVFVVLILISVALVISLVSNYIIFSIGRGYYLQLNGTRLDPLGLRVYPIEEHKEKSSDPEKPRVVFFGDSRAQQWSEPSELTQFEFINRGIGAQTSTQVVERYDDHIEPLHADFLLVQVCINDLKTIPLFPHMKSLIIEMCKENIERIVSETQDSQTVVILTTIIPLGKLPFVRRFFWSDDVGAAIEEVNEFIYSLEDERVIVFNTGAILTNEEGLVREEYSWDFLHLNEAGYEALNDELILILRDLEKAKVVNVR